MLIESSPRIIPRMQEDGQFSIQLSACDISDGQPQVASLSIISQNRLDTSGDCVIMENNQQHIHSG